jgi:hypothetical protein
MRNKIKVALIVSLMFLAGCQFLKPKPNQHLEKDMKEITKVINESADSINDSALTIDKNVITIKQHAKEVLIQSPETATLVKGIEKSANNIASESQKLKGVSLDLAKAGVKSDISERAIDTIVDRAIDAEKIQEEQAEKIIKLEENAKAGLNKMLKWIIGACVIGAGACAAMAVFFGNIKGGLTGAAACIVIMTLAIAVSQYMMYIAIAGGIIVVGTLGVLGYQLFIQRRAISDNVWTQEVAKRNMSEAIREKIYGTGEGKGQAGKIQSATTQKIIKNIKSKLPKGWHVTKED